MTSLAFYKSFLILVINFQRLPVGTFLKRSKTCRFEGNLDSGFTAVLLVNQQDILYFEFSSYSGSF